MNKNITLSFFFFFLLTDPKLLNSMCKFKPMMFTALKGGTQTVSVQFDLQ